MSKKGNCYWLPLFSTQLAGQLCAISKITIGISHYLHVDDV